MSRPSSFPPLPSERPLIGITTRLDTEDTFYLRRYYAEAVEFAGGVPVYIPLIPDREYLRSLIDRLDGVVLSGSNSDLDPALYGEEPHPKLSSVIPERDATDQLLLELIEERATPLLAICYGLQALNVARGGTLIQDIESQLDGAIKHEQGRVFNRPSHSIDFQVDSMLFDLAGTSRVRVNSSHHQAIARIGRDLNVIATAPDGIIEAVIDPRPDRFVLGVQWHPEIGWRQDPLSRAIFAHFVNVSRRNIRTYEQAI